MTTSLATGLPLLKPLTPTKCLPTPLHTTPALQWPFCHWTGDAQGPLPATMTVQPRLTAELCATRVHDPQMCTDLG